MTDLTLLKQFDSLRNYLSLHYSVPKNRRCQGLPRHKGYRLGNGFLASDKDTIYIYNKDRELVSGIRLEDDNNLWMLGRFKRSDVAIIFKTVERVTSVDYIKHQIQKHTNGNIFETMLRTVIDHAND